MVGRLNLERVSKKDGSYLLSYFETFLFQVMDAKNEILAKNWGTLEGSIDATPGKSDEETLAFASTLNQELDSVLRLQALEASRFGGDYGVAAYEEAQYVMATLADEIFLNMDWPGRRYWEDNLLESKIFGTHDAGDLFFSKLDDFLSRRDKLLKDIAEIYFLALGLGFLGKYRGQEDGGVIDQYKKELYLFINNRPYMLYETNEPIFASAYGYTLAEGKSILMQDWRKWMLVFGGVFLLMLLVSIIIWYHASSETAHVVDRIQSIIRAMV